MRLTFERTIRLPNYLARLIFWLRMDRATTKWNRLIPKIIEWIERDTETDPNAAFKWQHLVWQEIAMWIRLGEKVDRVDFEALCDRRGFNARMRLYLEEHLRHVWLCGWKKNDPVFWNPFNKVVQSHHDGEIDIEKTNRARALRGLPVPWSAELTTGE